jgi:hypothetical protein
MTNTNNPAHPTPAGAPPADDHGGLSGPPPRDVIARGYEADTYDTRTVVSVPLLVILFFVLAFGTVSLLFAFLAYPKPDPKANPQAVARDAAPLNDRLSRIYRGSKDGGGQPRLEPLRLRSGNERSITSPDLPVSAGNSPELHPEDLRATSDRYPALFATGDRKYGLDKTLNLSDAALTQLFPVQKVAESPVDSQHVPTGSNAGRGAHASVVVAPGPSLPPAPVTPPNPKGAH